MIDMKNKYLQQARWTYLDSFGKCLYFCGGALTILSLVTAPWSGWQILNQSGATIGFLLMILLPAGSRIQKSGIKVYFIMQFAQDAAVLLIWFCLLIIWIRIP